MNHIWSHTGHTKFSYMILLWLPRSPYMILIWHPRMQYDDLCVLSTPIQSLCSSSSFKRFTRLMAYWYHIWFLHGPYMVLIWSIYGSYMVHIWFLNVSYMVPACFLHGYYIVFYFTKTSNLLFYIVFLLKQMCHPNDSYKLR